MKKQRSVRAIFSLMLSVILFCMPVAACMGNGRNAMDAYAQEEAAEENNKDAEQTEKAEEGEKTEGTDHAAGMEEADGENNTRDQEGEEGTEPGDPVSEPEPECICQDRCTSYMVNKDCEACRENFSRCAYVSPNVKITIQTPSGWHNSTTKVQIAVEDVMQSGNFAMKTVQAKIAQNGSWTDITEDMYVEISENSTVYVLVTDQRGKTYEKNRYIKCFDVTKPTLNAAVSDGLLSIQAHDTDSGIQAVYVNGYEFKEITNGVLNVRLQQFDSGYQYFTIQAMDGAGNMSEVYKTANPYYTDPEKEDGSESDPAKQLPVNARATEPSSATAQVTEHTKTDENGNTVSETSAAEQKKAAMREAAEESGEETEEPEKGKEFYTIQTAGEKVFYLVIDRDGEEEVVYFLTEVSENDLLNVTRDNSETLPKNSAALESAIPVAEGALSNNNVEGELTEESEKTESGDGTEENPEETEEVEAEEENPLAIYGILGVVGVAVIGGGYYLKVVRKKKEEFLDEDDEDEEEYEDEEEEEETDDDFFTDDDREADAAKTIGED